MRQPSDDVLDTIDRAVDDWVVSADAMRWTPEPASVHPPVLLVSDAQAFAESFPRFREVMRSAVQEITRFVERLNGAGITPESVAKAQRQRQVAERQIARQLAIRDRRRVRNAQRARRRACRLT